MKKADKEEEKPNPKKGNEGYVYILSNPDLKGILKVGRTSDLPETRAKSLSRSSAIPRPYVKEWSKEVANIALAEMMLHYTLHEYSVSKEFFNIPLEDAINICNEALENLFKKINSKENLRIKELEIEAETITKELGAEIERLNEESSSGIATIPIGENDFTWDSVSDSLNYSFGKKAIELCLKEGKTGDPIRKRFISYRSNYLNAKRIDVFFNKAHITINVVSNEPDKVKSAIRKFYKDLYKNVSFSATKQGFSFQVKTNNEFSVLKVLLQMGKKHLKINP